MITIPRATKIVATLGPASNSPEMLARLFKAGVNVVRVNFSHGSAEQHTETVRLVREVAVGLGTDVGVLADLQGPKIRIGKFAEGKINLNPGDPFAFDIHCESGDQGVVGLDYKDLVNDVHPGDTLLLNDGRMTMRVLRVSDSRIECEVILGGVLSDRKGINRQGGGLSAPALTAKDMDDIKTAVGFQADFMAVSFPRNAADMYMARELNRAAGGKSLMIAKIERYEAIGNLEEILKSSDGIMVARGDLGVEMPLEAVPLVQKRAIELARRQAKPVIVATQVLESMIQNPRPTRAEASDCANAILDGADAVMLSGETSVGAYPIEAVRTMASIIENVEEHGGERIPGLGSYPQTRGGALTRAAAEMGEHLDVTYLVTFTQSGDTARRLSRLRSPLPLLAFTPLHETRNQLAVSWGVQCYEVPEVEHTDEMVAQVDEILQDKHLAQPGDTVVIVAGMPPGTPGSTNSIRVHTVGETGDYKV